MIYGVNKKQNTCTYSGNFVIVFLGTSIHIINYLIYSPYLFPLIVIECSSCKQQNSHNGDDAEQYCQYNCLVTYSTYTLQTSSSAMAERPRDSCCTSFKIEIECYRKNGKIIVF